MYRFLFIYFWKIVFIDFLFVYFLVFCLLRERERERGELKNKKKKHLGCDWDDQIQIQIESSSLTPRSSPSHFYSLFLWRSAFLYQFHQTYLLPFSFIGNYCFYLFRFLTQINSILFLLMNLKKALLSTVNLFTFSILKFYSMSPDFQLLFTFRFVGLWKFWLIYNMYMYADCV